MKWSPFYLLFLLFILISCGKDDAPPDNSFPCKLLKDVYSIGIDSITVLYNYNANGLVSRSTTTTSLSDSVITTYTYSGSRLQYSCMSGDTTFYEFDDSNRLTTITTSLNTTRLVYDEMGQISYSTRKSMNSLVGVIGDSIVYEWTNGNVTKSTYYTIPYLGIPMISYFNYDTKVNYLKVCGLPPVDQTYWSANNCTIVTIENNPQLTLLFTYGGYNSYNLPTSISVTYLGSSDPLIQHALTFQCK